MDTENQAALTAADKARPEANEGSDIATAPAAVTGHAEPVTGSVAAHIPGYDLPAKIDALHARHFAGTELTNHTPLWNKVMAFKDEVKALVAEHPDQTAAS